MFFPVFVALLCVHSVRAFLPVTPLTDCPNISPRSDFQIEQTVQESWARTASFEHRKMQPRFKYDLAPELALYTGQQLQLLVRNPTHVLTFNEVTGAWRLAYLLIDDNGNFEEDSTCAVAEIMQVNETQLELLLYVDGRKDEFTIDRYTKEFDVSILTPGEWLFHTSFAGLEFIHVTVIYFSPSQLILSFCTDSFSSEEAPKPHTEPINDYDSFINIIDRDSMDDIFKAQNYNQFFKDVDDLGVRLNRQRRVRRPSRLFRGKRFAEDLKETHKESGQEKVMKLLKNKSLGKLKKHLWTVILVKDNNTSALRFVENASMLMKLGFQIKEGQLISFGSCYLNRK